ncbi:hypothetical protein [Spirosoma validum]|uniref:CPBP family intramembrane metalloprotease n=1 Tax=Spirosoma validum TaxID=2771355 RepID=A0A927GBX8_9BACT|nr:hypothetical protein [Spirosoma validum]MBD2752079.1 hypothetical protein [Spirosoma validum]
MNTLPTSFSNFQNYIFRPIYRLPLANQPNKSIATTLRQFLTEYPLLLGLLLLSVGSIVLEELITGQNLFTLLMQRTHSSPIILLLALPLAIIIQEKIFRSILYLTPKRLKGIGILILCIPICYYVHSLNKSANMQAALVVMMSVWIVAVILAVRYLKRPVVFERINQFWQTNFRWIFYGFTFLYATGITVNHLDTLADWKGLLLPILLLSGLLSGFYFGYIRMKYGFWYAVAVHILLIATPLAVEMIRTL